MFTKKGLGAVVATSLLLIVGVVAVTSFQSWYQTFQSTALVDVKENSDNSNALTIEQVIGSKVYVNSRANKNITLDSIQIGGVQCNVSFQILTKGINEIDIGLCALGAQNSGDILVATDNGVTVEKENLESSLRSISTNLEYIFPTPEDDTIYFSSQDITINLSADYDFNSCTLVWDDGSLTNYTMTVDGNNCYYTFSSLVMGEYSFSVNTVIDVDGTSYSQSLQERFFEIISLGTFSHGSNSELAAGSYSTITTDLISGVLSLNNYIEEYDAETVSVWTGETGQVGTCGGCSSSNAVYVRRTNSGSGTGTLEQTNIAVPTNAVNITMERWSTGGGAASNHFQFFYVNNVQIRNLEYAPYWSWFTDSFDISSYAGQIIEIDFRLWTGCSGACNPETRIDDIRFTDANGNDIGPRANSSTYTSEELDFGEPVNLHNITWVGTTPTNTQLRLQVAGNNDQSTWSYVGPDGTSGTYFTTSGEETPDSLNGFRYYQYRVYLTSNDSISSPTFDQISLIYSNASSWIESTDTHFGDGTLNNIDLSQVSVGDITLENEGISNPKFMTSRDWSGTGFSLQSSTCSGCSSPYSGYTSRTTTYSGTGHITQNSVKIPSDAVNMTLSKRNSGGGVADNHFIRLYFGGVYVQDLETNNWAWGEETFDISSYAGTTQNIDFQVSTNCMANCGPYIYVDDIKFVDLNGDEVVEYKTSGNYTSNVYDFGSGKNYRRVEYNVDEPTDTNIQINVGAGNTASPDGSWIWVNDLESLDSLDSLDGRRYVQYTINMTTSDISKTPILYEIKIK